MKKLLLAFAFIFLFVLSVWALNAGQDETYYLPAGEVLTVAAPPGTTGLVVRLSRAPGGGDPQSVTAINGANLTFGAYPQTERFKISVTAGAVTVTISKEDPLALQNATVDNTIIGSSTAAAGTFTNITATGTIKGLTEVINGSANLTMTTAQVAGTVWNNTGQGIADVEHRLPAAANGLHFRAVITENSANYVRFLAAENAAVIAFNGTSGKTYVGMNAPTIGATLDMISLQVASTGILTTPALSIGSTNTAVASGAFTFDIAGTGYAKAAVTAGTAPGNDVIPANVVGAVAFDIGADGTIDVIEADGNATGYATAALAIAGIAATEAAHVRMGTVTAKMTGGEFTFGTTPLNAANTTVIYTSTAPYTRPYNWIATGILGEWLTD
jgi:hypothetical protein